MLSLDIFIPTRNRLQSLITALTGVAVQNVANVHLVVADQSDHRARDSEVVSMLLWVIEARGASVEWYEREAQGIAEQRDFLLGCALWRFTVVAARITLARRLHPQVT